MARDAGGFLNGDGALGRQAAFRVPKPVPDHRLGGADPLSERLLPPGDVDGSLQC